MKARAMMVVAVAGCQAPPPSETPKAPPTVVTDSAVAPRAPFRSLPPPMLPVDCKEAARVGAVEFCGQRLGTAVTHAACHRTDQVSTAALACLPELRSLTLRNTKVARLEPLRRLTHLRRLNLSRTNVVDLGPLTGVRSLRELALDGTQVIDLTPLAALPELSKLRLRGTPSVDWSTLSGLPSLSELDVTGNQRPDLSALAGHAVLQRVSVPDSVTDVTPLVDMPELRKLVVRHEYFEGADEERQRRVVEGLGAITELRELVLHGSKATSLAPLASMSKLESLWFDAPRVTSLAPLTKLENLSFVGLADTRGLGDRRQAELSSLGSLPKLVSLTVFLSPHDTSYLRAFPRLEGLALSALPYETLDISGIAALPKLDVLEIHGGKVERLSPLVRAKGLTRFEIKPSADVPSSEVEALRRARPRLDISYSPEASDGPDDW